MVDEDVRLQIESLQAQTALLEASLREARQECDETKQMAVRLQTQWQQTKPLPMTTNNNNNNRDTTNDMERLQAELEDRTALLQQIQGSVRTLEERIQGLQESNQQQQQQDTPQEEPKQDSSQKEEEEEIHAPEEPEQQAILEEEEQQDAKEERQPKCEEDIILEVESATEEDPTSPSF